MSGYRYVSPKILAKAEPIFANFLARDGFNSEIAAEEFKRITSCFGNPGSCLSKDGYIRESRVGSKNPLNRAKRLSIYAAFENAMNHAAFELESGK